MVGEKSPRLFINSEFEMLNNALIIWYMQQFVLLIYLITRKK